MSNTPRPANKTQRPCWCVASINLLAGRGARVGDMFAGGLGQSRQHRLRSAGHPSRNRGRLVRHRSCKDNLYQCTTPPPIHFLKMFINVCACVRGLVYTWCEWGACTIYSYAVFGAKIEKRFIHYIPKLLCAGLSSLTTHHYDSSI